VTVRLRPHHLLCLLTYVGRGYTPAFTANFDAIASRLNSGEEVEIVHGLDEICAALAGEEEAHCGGDSVTERDRQAARDLSLLLDAPIAAGARFSLDAERLTHMRAAFAEGTVRAACTGCDWSDLCETVAGGGYGNARIEGPAGSARRA